MWDMAMAVGSFASIQNPYTTENVQQEGHVNSEIKLFLAKSNGDIELKQSKAGLKNGRNLVSLRRMFLRHNARRGSIPSASTNSNQSHTIA